MLYFAEDLEKDGPTGKSLPQIPRENLKSLLGANSKVSKLLSGQDLHKYLVQNLATQDPVNCPKVSGAGLFTSLESILNNLKSGYALLRKQNSLSLSASLDYGEWLNLAFELHSTEKLAGKITGTWKEWLEGNVGIQDSYARKLREIAKLLGKYPRFRTVGLSFSEIYKHRKQVQGMLITDSTLAQFWQETN